MPAAINPFAMHLTLSLSCGGMLGGQVSTTESPWESAEMHYRITNFPCCPQSLCESGSYAKMELNALKIADYLNARVMQGHISALARKQEKAGKSNQFLMQTVPMKYVIRCVVLYAKQFSRRKCGARNHGDSLLISK